MAVLNFLCDSYLLEWILKEHSMAGLFSTPCQWHSQVGGKKKKKKAGRDNNTVPRGFFHVAVVSVCDVRKRILSIVVMH